MIVAQREVHHRTNHDLSINRDRALLDTVHPENPRLRRIDDRGAEERSVDPAVRDRKNATLKIWQTELAVAGLRCVIDDVFLDLGKTLLITVADHGDDEALLRADRDTDVVEVVLDDLFPLDPAIHRRDGLERFDDGLDEEGHEADFHPVAGGEIVLKALAQVHHRAHVDLVEGRENGGLMLGVDEVGGDLAAQRRHLLPRGALGSTRGFDHRSRWLGGFDAGRIENVGLGDLAPGAGATDTIEIDPLTLRHFAGDGSGFHFRSVTCGDSGVRGSLFLCSSRSGRGSIRRSCRTLVNARHRRTDREFITDRGEVMERSGTIGLKFGGDLVGLDREDDLTGPDVGPFGLVPGAEGGGGDGFTDGRNLDLVQHDKKQGLKRNLKQCLGG